MATIIVDTTPAGGMFYKERWPNAGANRTVGEDYACVGWVEEGAAGLGRKIALPSALLYIATTTTHLRLVIDCQSYTCKRSFPDVHPRPQQYLQERLKTPSTPSDRQI